MGRVEGKVALVTGAGRGQGRSHAIRLAEEGADIIAVDGCVDVGSVDYAMASSADLKETVAKIEALGRRVVSGEVDVRDASGMAQIAKQGYDELGRLDIVCANAGIWSGGMLTDLTEASWQDMIDVNLTGVWHTVKACIPHMQAAGNGGSIIMTSSAGGLRGYHSTGHYVAAKHGVVGLMRTAALELADQMIRVNSVHPTTVGTDMVFNDFALRYFLPNSPNPTPEEFAEAAKPANALPIAWIEPVDVSNAVLFLASDEARYITGVALPVDAGNLLK